MCSTPHPAYSNDPCFAPQTTIHHENQTQPKTYIPLTLCPSPTTPCCRHTHTLPLPGNALFDYYHHNQQSPSSQIINDNSIQGYLLPPSALPSNKQFTITHFYGDGFPGLIRTGEVRFCCYGGEVDGRGDMGDIGEREEEEEEEKWWMDGDGRWEYGVEASRRKVGDTGEEVPILVSYGLFWGFVVGSGGVGVEEERGEEEEGDEDEGEEEVERDLIWDEMDIGDCDGAGDSDDEDDDEDGYDDETEMDDEDEDEDEDEDGYEDEIEMEHEDVSSPSEANSPSEAHSPSGTHPSSKSPNSPAKPLSISKKPPQFRPQKLLILWEPTCAEKSEIDVAETDLTHCGDAFLNHVLGVCARRGWVDSFVLCWGVC